MSAPSTPVRAAAVDPTEWVDRYGDLLMSYALARLHSQELAEDLVQETFLAAWKGYRKFDAKCRFSTWLVAILRRKIADHYRTAGRSAESLDDQPEVAADFTKRGKWAHKLCKWSAQPDELVENQEFWHVFAGCLQAMPSHLSYVFRLRELKSSKLHEISRLLDTTENNVAVRLHRARLMLRGCLEKKWFQEN